MQLYILILQFSVPQTFGEDFTDRYLKHFLRNQQRVDVHVSSMASKRPMIVRMMMGFRSNNAIFKVGWDNFVRRYKLKEGDIVLFSFNERDDGELHVLVEALPCC